MNKLSVYYRTCRPNHVKCTIVVLCLGEMRKGEVQIIALAFFYQSLVFFYFCLFVLLFSHYFKCQSHKADCAFFRGLLIKAELYLDPNPKSVKPNVALLSTITSGHIHSDSSSELPQDMYWKKSQFYRQLVYKPHFTIWAVWAVW